MQIDDVKQVLVVGAGTMGQQIAFQCATHGYPVVVYDIAAAALAGAQTQIQGFAALLQGQGRLTQAEAEATLARLSYSSDAQEAAANADLLSESVPEDPALKARVFAQFNALCPPRTIFTTNTSLLLPSMYAEATGRPAQFAALHFHSYVWDANLADVMAHPGTSPETVALLTEFARRIGQIPMVLHREHNGYVLNTMLSALNGAAITMAANGVATPEQIDRAWMVVMKMPIGPMGILDLVGIETAWHVARWAADTAGDPQYRINADFLKGYIDRGWLGMKTGRGFFTYPDPAYARPGFLAEA